MKKLCVRHGSGAYGISIGNGLLRQQGLFKLAENRAVLVVTDDIVKPLWLDKLLSCVPGARWLALPSGEENKTLETVSSIWSELSAIGLGRGGLLVALGGGVVGDMTGFAAACWMRGIDFLQIPTTLLAQVDASVGGKTAIDLPAGKNLVGAFHQPAAVIIDTDTLDTLPSRDYLAGLSEVVKTALIAGTDFLDWLKANATAIMQRDKLTLETMIARCCEFKAAIVSEDERERGNRALLNLGHTFGHAIETVSGYSRLLHGEAVSIGLVLACRLSERSCGLDTQTRHRVERLLETFSLPTELPADLDRAELLESMKLDKKNTRTGWRLVLLRSPGACFLQEFPQPDELRALLESV